MEENKSSNENVAPTTNSTEEVPVVCKANAYFDMRNFQEMMKFSFNANLPNWSPRKMAEFIAEKNGWKMGDINIYLDLTGQETTFRIKTWRLRCEDYVEDKMRVHVMPFELRKAMLDPEVGGSTMVVDEIYNTSMLAMQVIQDIVSGKANVIVLFTADKHRYKSVVNYVRNYAKQNNIWIKLVNAYPFSDLPSPDGSYRNKRSGIDRTDWVRVTNALYEYSQEFIKLPARSEKRQDNQEDQSLKTDPLLDFSNTNAPALAESQVKE